MKWLASLAIVVAAVLTVLMVQQRSRLAALEAELARAKSRAQPTVEENVPEGEPPMSGEPVDLRAQVEHTNLEVERLQRELADAREQRDANRVELDKFRGAIDEKQDAIAAKEAVFEAAQANRERPDTAAELALLAAAQRYVEDAEILTVDDLSARERAMLGPYAAELTMVRHGDEIGLYGLGGDGIPEHLRPWVDAYAAVSTEYRVERDRVVADLIARGDAPQFDHKFDAATYTGEQRAAYFEQHGVEHPGFHYERVGGQGFVLVDRGQLTADARVAELGALRDEVGARLGDGEQAVGLTEKWIPGQPDPPEDQ